MPDSRKFRFAIDRGGTFTDIYAELPGNQTPRVLKLLSVNPDHYSDSALEGIRRIMKEADPESTYLDPDKIEWIRMGTTLATNALLERKGSRTALLISNGFKDLLLIGKQNRPDIFDLQVRKPSPLYETVVEVNERVRLLKPDDPNRNIRGKQVATGDWIEVLQAPDPYAVREDLLSLKARGIESIAIVLMHSYAFDEHEQLLGKLAQEVGFQNVSMSSQVIPRIKMLDRGQTCSVDAYLNPVIQKYLTNFQSGFPEVFPRLFFMQSDGGLVPADSFRGSQAILSGPAGGVVGVAETAYDRSHPQPVIGFDMGGTSTDVSRYDGDFEWEHETEIAGVSILTPQLNIKTVAAGGGSRLLFKSGMFQVGPESSGSHPGPVCYGKKGPLSLTDANLFLGRLLPESLPEIFGETGDQPLDLCATNQAFKDLTLKVQAQSGAKETGCKSAEEVALGFIQVANETMARPVRELSVARGYDLKKHILSCFGGAGGQHACALARILGIKKIKIHRHAGILSAYGLGLADRTAEMQEPVSMVLDEESKTVLLDRLNQLKVRTIGKLDGEGREVEAKGYLNLRYQGTSTQFMVAQPVDDDFESVFKSTYQREFGFKMSGRPVQVDDIRVRAVKKFPALARQKIKSGSSSSQPKTFTQVYFEEGWVKTPVYEWDVLGAGEEISGPAIIVQDTTTVLVEPGSLLTMSEWGDVEIDITANPEPNVDIECDPVQLAIFANKFMSIAEQMGRTLERTAISTNIKERHDFSCALFGPSGDLVANAPHQPVHLGSIGEAVRLQFQYYENRIQPGDVWVSNHPAMGGSHLPDITVITPVLRNGKPIFFVANRGHHADIGGIAPGSMPPFSTTLQEEGVSIKSFKLVEGGVFKETEMRALLSQPVDTHPSRTVEDNIADLKAQVAANQKGIDLINEMIRHYSLETVQAYMGYIQDSADTAVRDMLIRISEERGLKELDTIEASEPMDDGTQISLSLTIDRTQGRAVFDFSGTGSQVEGNCNAPQTVAWSAILYCLRSLVCSDIPLNQGCLQPIEIRIPERSILHPSENSAVAGGNVLTSQRVTDVILKAFSAVAASQGCMNNLTFGNERFGYYETLGGGAGAGPGWNGSSGVHTHMTNTRITDPEILEKYYPVLLREFSIRPNSGGTGKYRGGDGLIREIEFIEALSVAILSERRVFPPYGLNGGKPGASGKNLWIKRDGVNQELEGKDQFLAQIGDRIRILTPGGGGFDSE